MKLKLYRLANDCLPSLAVAASAGILALAIWQVRAVLEDSRNVHVLQETIVSAVAAEEAAFAAADEEHTIEKGILQVRSISGMLSSVSFPEQKQPQRMRIEVRGRNHRYYAYHCEMLDGAAPKALGFPLSISMRIVDQRDELRLWLRRQSNMNINLMADDEHPSLLTHKEDAPSLHQLRSLGVLQDKSLGLLRTPSGTDLPDFVFATNEHGIARPKAPLSGTLVLNGHLWVDHGARPLIIELSQPLTVVARGNIYLGRSIGVRGAGKLTLVAQQSESEMFADRNADGRWGRGDELLTGKTYRGPTEGTGAIYFGLPAQPHRPGDLRVSASLYAQGEVHLLPRRVQVQGALVVGHGLTWLGRTALDVPGSRLPNTEREPVPGFARSGGLRPSMLRPDR